MTRWLTFLIILTMVAAQGPAFAAAICHHQDLVQHVQARQSAQATIAAEALAEEKAVEGAAKKGQLAAAANLYLSGMPSPSPVFPPRRPAGQIVHFAADAPELAGRALSPPLQPPTA